MRDGRREERGGFIDDDDELAVKLLKPKVAH